MADTKISDLTDGGTILAGDAIPVVRGGANFKVSVSAASIGYQLLRVDTTAAGQNILGVGAVGRTLFQSATTAAATNALGAGAFGGNFLTVATTAAALNQLGGATGAGAVVLTSAATLYNPNTVGTTTNDNAAAGSVGQVISSDIALGSAVALTNNALVNITSITLTAGDWDVYGNTFYNANAATAVTGVLGIISDTSAAQNPGFGTGSSEVWFGSTTGSAPARSPAGNRFTVANAATKIIYLVTLCQFTVNTLAAYGFIWARRAR